MFFLHLFTENYTKNMKQKHIILLFISMTLIVFYLITNSWGEPESKLIKSKDKISIGKGFESISGTLWENNTQDLSSSEIGFYIEGLKDTKGYFEDFNVVLKVPKNKPENAKIKVSIKVSSINTDNSTRDKALMDEEFFNENKFPTIDFYSKEIIENDTNFTANGILHMMGKKHPLLLNFKYLGIAKNKLGIYVAIFDGLLNIDRTKFGMLPVSSIGNDVQIKFYCELIKKK